MATIKSHTDIEQSKKLAETLPLERADMCYYNDGTAIKIDANSYPVRNSMWKDYYVEVIPCWSLAALFDILPKDIGDYRKYLYYDACEYHCGYIGNGDIMFTLEETKADNPIDACYEMIIKLDEQNLI